jgi:hypothetical protein
MDAHVVAVSGRVVCLNVATYTTTGVIMEITERCDCVDHVSKRTQYRRDADAKEKKRWDKFADDVRDAVARGEIGTLHTIKPEE